MRPLFFLSLIIPSPVFGMCVAAGQNSSIGGESCAETQVTLSVPALANAILLEPFDLGQFDYETAPVSGSDFCIWYNTENFTLTVTSLNTKNDNRFYLAGTNLNRTVEYNVTWFNQAGFSGTAYNLTNQENVVQRGLTLPNKADSYQCVNKNVSLEVKVPVDNLQDKPEDIYSDVLTVTVAVE